MEQIDISKLKNVKNSLTETEIFELNGILNSGEIYEKISKVHQFYRKQVVYICIFLCILVIWTIFYTMWECGNDSCDTKMLANAILWGLSFWAPVILFYAVIRVVFKFHTLDKIELLEKIFSQKIGKMTVIDEEKLQDIPEEDFKNRSIITSKYDYFNVEDGFIIQKNNDIIRFFEVAFMSGHWKSRRTVMHKVFWLRDFAWNFEMWNILIQMKGSNSKNPWKIFRKIAFFSILFWILYEIYFQNQGVFLLSSILIFIVYIWDIIEFFRQKLKKRTKIIFPDSEFSRQFSVYSENIWVSEIFSRDEIQEKFLDFFENSKYSYDISLGKNNVILSRNVRNEFLEFTYSYSVEGFLEEFIDFYIEQKNIQKFFEEMKIFYK